MELRSHSQLLLELKEKLRQLERPRLLSQKNVVCSTGIDSLDRLLPQGGIAAGSLIEWLNKGAGSGGAALALMIARRMQRSGGLLVVIDGKRRFYPPGAEALGMSLRQTMVIQAAGMLDLLWAWEQVLRSAAVAVAVGWVEQLPDRAYRRLQLAAEAAGTMGFLLRPEAYRTEPCWAEARLLIEALPGEDSRLSRRLRVELLQCRGGRSGGSVEV